MPLQYHTVTARVCQVTSRQGLIHPHNRSPLQEPRKAGVNWTQIRPLALQAFVHFSFFCAFWSSVRHCSPSSRRCCLHLRIKSKVYNQWVLVTDLPMPRRIHVGECLTKFGLTFELPTNLPPTPIFAHLRKYKSSMAVCLSGHQLRVIC